MQAHMEATLVSGALKNALHSICLSMIPDLVFHSDRGSQYVSKLCKDTLSDYRLIPSMSRKGNCWDNSVAESFFSSLKMEEFYTRTIPSKSEVRGILFDYIECFYNRKRLHGMLGYKSPMDYEQEF